MIYMHPLDWQLLQENKTLQASDENRDPLEVLANSSLSETHSASLLDTEVNESRSSHDPS